MKDSQQMCRRHHYRTSDEDHHIGRRADARNGHTAERQDGGEGRLHRGIDVPAEPAQRDDQTA